MGLKVETKLLSCTFKYIITPFVLVLLVLCTIGIFGVNIGHLYGGDVTEAHILDTMRKYDSVILNNITISQHVIRPHASLYESKPVRVTQDMKLAIHNGVWAAHRMTSPNEKPPEYIQLPEGILRDLINSPAWNYDNSGNLTVTRDMACYSLAESDFRGTRRHRSMYTISPDGSVIKKEMAPLVELRRATEPLGSGEIYIPLLTTGRGYGKLLDNVTKIESRENNIVYIEAMGRYCDGNPCVWALTIDKGAGYLVRKAVCSLRKGGAILAQFETFGTKVHQKGIMPQTARFIFDPKSKDNQEDHAWDVTLTKIENNADEEFISTVRSMLRGKLPEGTAIFDYRQGSRPIRLTVGSTDEPFLNVTNKSKPEVSSQDKTRMDEHESKIWKFIFASIVIALAACLLFFLRKRDAR